MKKTLFSSLFILLVGFTAQVSAQVYSETYLRTHPIPPSKVSDKNKICGSGGWTYVHQFFTKLTATVRGVQQFSTDVPTDFPTQGAVTGVTDGPIEKLFFSYKDLTSTCKIEVPAGLEFTIETTGGTKWGNVALFVDWDGNGVFDDHDPHLYNLYGGTGVYIDEHAGADGGEGLFQFGKLKCLKI